MQLQKTDSRKESEDVSKSRLCQKKNFSKTINFWKNPRKNETSIARQSMKY